MSESEPISEEQILEILECDGRSWRDYFLSGETETICWFVPGIGVRGMLIEDEGSRRACKAFLRIMGAEHLATLEDVKRRFGWDGVNKAGAGNGAGALVSLESL